MRSLFRTYYMPGSFSAALLPVLFCLFVTYQGVIRKQYAIQVNYPRSDFIPPNRTYSFIEIIDNDEQNERQLRTAQILIRKLQISGDTSTGILIHFSNNAHYWTLIKALDICSIEKVKYYDFCEGGLWITNISKSIKIHKGKILPRYEIRPVCL